MLNIETRDMFEMIGYLSEMNDDVRDYLHSINFFKKMESYIAREYGKSGGPIYLHQKYSSYIIKSMVENLASKGMVDVKYGPDSLGNYTFQNTWIKISIHTPDFIRTGISLLSGPMSLIKLGDDFKLPDPIAVYNFVTQTIDRYEHSLHDNTVNEGFIETLYDFITFKLDAYAFFTKHIGIEPSEMLNTLRSVINSMSNGYERIINKYKDMKTESVDSDDTDDWVYKNWGKFFKEYAKLYDEKYDEFGKEIKKDTSKPRRIVESVGKPYVAIGEYLTEADADMIYRNYNYAKYHNTLNNFAKCEIIRQYEEARDNDKFALGVIITEDFNEIDVITHVESGSMYVIKDTDTTQAFGTNQIDIKTECVKAGSIESPVLSIGYAKGYNIWYGNDIFSRV